MTRARLAAAFPRYHPDTVIVWCGVNDSWNRAAAPATGASLLTRLGGFAVAYVRLYRLLRTRLHDRGLDAALARLPGLG